MPQIPIFVINLKRSEERRTRVQEALDSLGLTYEFIEAVDGNDLSDSEVAEIRARQSGWIKRLMAARPIFRGEIGCALSHLKVYEKVVHENLDYACIMEDDMVVDHPWILRHLLEKHNLLALNKKRPFDFIYLSVNEPMRDQLLRNAAAMRRMFLHRTEQEIAAGYFLCKPSVSPIWGTLAYIVNKKACGTLLTKGSPVVMPADLLMSASELFGIKQYLINPLPVRPAMELRSTIDPDRKIRAYNKKLYSIKAAHSSQIGSQFFSKFIFLLKTMGLIKYKWLVIKNMYFRARFKSHSNRTMPCKTPRH